jgi:hypothetical protein
MRDQAAVTNIRLEQLQEAEENYYITAKCVLKVINKAYELFLSSEPDFVKTSSGMVDEKRQLIKLILSNLKLDDEKIVWDVQKPFDLILETTDRKRFGYNSLFLAKALPEPDFKYFSNASA